MFRMRRRHQYVCSTLSVTLFVLSVFLLAPYRCWGQEEANDREERTQSSADHQYTGDPGNNSKLPTSTNFPYHHDEEFIRELFLKYGDGTGRLTFRGFAELMGSIGLGGGPGEVHDHREEGGVQPHGHDSETHRHVEHGYQPGATPEPDDHLHEDHGDVDESTMSTTDAAPSPSDSVDHDGGVTEAAGDDHQEGAEETSTRDGREHTHLTQCLSPDTLLGIFEIPTESTGLTEEQFLQMCPVLLQQLDSHVCMQFDVNVGTDHDDHDHEGTSTHGHDEDVTHGHHGDVNVTVSAAGHFPGHIWGYGIAAITLISLASIACILVVPCMQHYPNVYHFLLSFLVAMAVGTLSGDAMMHLIPHSLGIHLHDEKPTVKEEDDHAHEALEAEKQHAINAVWKGFLVLIGIFLFFIVEQLMGFFRQARKNRKAHRKTRHRADQKSSSQRPLHNSHHDDSEDVHQELQGEYRPMKGNDAIGEKLCHHCVSVGQANRATNSEIIRNSMLLIEDVEMNGHIDQASSSHHHHHHHHHHDDDPESGPTHHHSHGHSHGAPLAGDSSITTLAWIVVMGDGLHNFCDGLIVGAAFADSIAGGLSTSIAVMCHEVPHELGDFAVMLKGGMSVKQALCVQAVSSVLAYMGLAIGITAGNIESVSMWIFALAGGMFVYIALVDLFPELIETLKSKPGRTIQLLVLQSAGTALGVLIMLMIGLHEDWLLEQLDG